MIPAALAAKELGKPVKIVFQRPDDSRFDCCRSASVARLDASFDADGNVTGIEHAMAAGWPTLAMAPGFMPDAVDGNGKYDPFATSGSDHWYTLANHRVRSINNDLAQRTFLPGWLRAVGELEGAVHPPDVGRGACRVAASGNISGSSRPAATSLISLMCSLAAA